MFERHLPFIYPAHVTIEFGKPFIVKELEPEQRKFAGAYTRSVIIEMLKAEMARSVRKDKREGFRDLLEDKRETGRR